VDGGDTADDDAVTARPEKFDRRVIEEGVFCRSQAASFGQPERGNPVGIAGVTFVGVVDETTEIPPSRDGSNVQHRAFILLRGAFGPWWPGDVVNTLIRYAWTLWVEMN